MESANTDQKVLDLTGVDLKKTVNLPQTTFPMKANLAALEPKLLEQWEKSGIYERIRQARAGTANVYFARRSSVRKRQHSLGACLQQIVEGFHCQTEKYGGF
jgi:isoleucyl-tRNA synthetase